MAKKGTISEEGIQPWFTGPILSPSSLVVEAGHWGVEPYFSVYDFPANYNEDWKAEEIPNFLSIELEPYSWVGLTNWMDLSFHPTLFWNHDQKGGGSWALGDLIIQPEFQLWDESWSDASWTPNVKLGIKETIPIGKYRNLVPQKKYTDQGGFGTWITNANLTFGKIFHIKDCQFLSWRFHLSWNFFHSIVHIKGYNAYGGGIGANGRVRPGMSLTSFLSFEYSVSRNWVLVMEFAGFWQQKGKFQGNPGINFIEGPETVITLTNATQYSLAPAIEYNWNENLGIIAGTWFTIAGKQSSEFYSFIFAVNYYK